MKKIVLVIVLLMAGLMRLSAQSIDGLFKAFKGKDHVECVEIPKMLISVAKGFVKNEEGGKILKKVKHVRILDIEDDAALCTQFADMARTLNKKGYETLVSSNEDQEKNLVLVKTKGDAIVEVVVLDIEPTECSLVQVKGKFNSSDIHQLGKL